MKVEVCVYEGKILFLHRKNCINRATAGVL